MRIGWVLRPERKGSVGQMDPCMETIDRIDFGGNAASCILSQQRSTDAVNNRLQALMNLTYLLERRHTEDETAREYLTSMQAELARLNLHLRSQVREG